MTKKIVVSFDGTWNTPDTKSDEEGGGSTNVCKLHDAILATDDAGVVQDKWYEKGVGTKWYNKLRGGAFGVGLTEKILKGYKHLVDHYQEGDEVFIFGFSRGAYSARSLVGLIRNAGLLRKENARLIPDANALYRTRDEGADSENAKFFRGRYSREIDIHCLGVWDTVGALGIPVESFDWFNKAYYQFHDVELSSIVKNAFHATAVDEHRKNYDCALWDPKQKPNQHMEQVWFSGAHANVGGGYPGNRLSDVALAWMMEKAQGCGLALDPAKVPEIAPDVLLLNNSKKCIKDSYKEFLGGAYSRFESRSYRHVGFRANGQEAIHATVIDRTKHDPEYRPKNKVGAMLIGEFKPVSRIYE